MAQGSRHGWRLEAFLPPFGAKALIIQGFTEIDVAVQQNKKSPSKRGMHRSHDFLTNPPTAVEPTTGEIHLRHHVSPSGYYRGKKVVKTKAVA